MTTHSVLGYHHATAMAGEAQSNLDFYGGVLGLRLVKRSVNQDAPDVYHLFYADGVGTPGTDITFFPWPQVAPFRLGTGTILEQGLAIPLASLEWWYEHLSAQGIEVRREEEWGKPALRFRDPDGLALALVGTRDAHPFTPWLGSPGPPEHQIRGLYTAQICVASLGATDRVLTEILGFHKVDTQGNKHLYTVGREGEWGYGFLEVWARPDLAPGRWGKGGMHHLAWRTRDDSHLEALRAQLQQIGLAPTPIIDRFWFHSVYFREPGGVLFELATDGPGFGIDEPVEQLGERLVLPPWLEPRRAEIEAKLPPLRLPRSTLEHAPPAPPEPMG